MVTSVAISWSWGGGGGIPTWDQLISSPNEGIFIVIENQEIT